jgi:hypothetical protein
MDSPVGDERKWWDSLPSEVKKKVRDFVNQSEVDLDLSTIEAHIAEAGDFLDPIREKLAQLNETLATVRTSLEAAMFSYYQLDGEVRDFISEDGHKMEDLQEVLWRRLGDPRGRVSLIARRLKTLDSLLEEMDLALDPDTSPFLEEQLEIARRAGDLAKVGLLGKTIRMKRRLKAGPTSTMPR